MLLEYHMIDLAFNFQLLHRSSNFVFLSISDRKKKPELVDILKI